MVTIEQIKQAVAARRLHMHVDPETGFRTLKYKKDVFFKGDWDEVTEECRGMVFDHDWNLLAYPFTKIYNYGIEARAPKIKDDEVVRACEKINGFMLSVWAHGDQVYCSTTGSTNSDFVKIGYRWLEKLNLRDRPDLFTGYTYMFECVDPSDPHIIDEEPGLYFLGCRRNALGSELVVYESAFMEQVFGVKNPHQRYMTMREAKEYVRECKTEGLVVYASNGRATKIKSPYYLALKLVSRTNLSRLTDAQAKARMDEEFYPLIDYARSVEGWGELSNEERVQLAREFIDNMAKGY